MTLFHGTNQDVEAIDLTKGLPYKDFGQGFYLTPDRVTAERMAKKRALLFGGEPLVIEYSFDEQMASTALQILTFSQKATVEWARFVDRNRDRSSEPYHHDYDIVSGPIANDGVAYLLGRFHEGTMTLEELAEGLQDKYLDQQFFFGSERALHYLIKQTVYRL